MAGCCERGSEPSGCIKLGEFFTVWGRVIFSRSTLFHVVSQSDRIGHSRMKMQSVCYNSGSTPWYTIGTSLAHHRHAIGTQSERHNQTTDTPQAHTWHTIGTPSTHHWHAIGTPLTQHRNIKSLHRHTFGTLLAHPWHATSTPMAHSRPHVRSGCCHQENNLLSALEWLSYTWRKQLYQLRLFVVLRNVWRFPFINAMIL